MLHMPAGACIWIHIKTPKSKRAPLKTRTHCDPVTPPLNSGKGGSRCGGRGVGRTRLALWFTGNNLKVRGVWEDVHPVFGVAVFTWEGSGR